LKEVFFLSFFSSFSLLDPLRPTVRRWRDFLPFFFHYGTACGVNGGERKLTAGTFFFPFLPFLVEVVCVDQEPQVYRRRCERPLFFFLLSSLPPVARR